MFENEIKAYIDHEVTLIRTVKNDVEQHGVITIENATYYFTPIIRGKRIESDKVEISPSDIKAIVQSDFENVNHKDDFEALLRIASNPSQHSKGGE